MRSIQDTLREKESQISILQREIEILRAAAKILVSEPNGAGARKTAVLSQPQMIRVVLVDRGHPMHIDEIAQAIEKQFNVKLKRTDIRPAIYRAIRSKKLFRKEAKNTFGLLEWSTPGKSDEASNSR